ncbi:MAG TPA: DUF4239 domain-containing protein [Candidatus Omnitrophota bacterium]|nr:DUF4239 domain-containing protein [Candidatus Omnitrophota bacterium]
MSFIQTLLYYLSTPALAILIIAIYVGFSIAGLCIVRSFFPFHKLKLHNDVAGFIFATLGVIYAVLLAFLVVVTWQGFDSASQNAAKEANYLADLYRDSMPLSSDFHSRLKLELKQYASDIVDHEWQIMPRGLRSEVVQQDQQRIWDLFSSYRPVNETQKVFFSESVRKLNEACEARRQRLLDATSGLSPILYFILILGGLITVGYTVMFGTENFVPQIIMTSMLAVMIALTLFTIIALDYPFSGDISIKPTVFRMVLNTLLGS